MTSEEFRERLQRLANGLPEREARAVAQELLNEVDEFLRLGAKLARLTDELHQRVMAERPQPWWKGVVARLLERLT